MPLGITPLTRRVFDAKATPTPRDWSSLDQLGKLTAFVKTDLKKAAAQVAKFDGDIVPVDPTEKYRGPQGSLLDVARHFVKGSSSTFDNYEGKMIDAGPTFMKSLNQLRTGAALLTAARDASVQDGDKVPASVAQKITATTDAYVKMFAAVDVLHQGIKDQHELSPAEIKVTEAGLNALQAAIKTFGKNSPDTQSVSR